jgi:hypothetical protein
MRRRIPPSWSGLLLVEHAGVAKLAGAVVVSGLVAVRTWG